MKRALIALPLLLLAGCASQQIEHALTNLEHCRRDYVGTVGGTVPATTLSVNIHCDPQPPPTP